MSKLVGLSVAIASVIAALVVLLGTAYPTVALYAGLWDLTHHGRLDQAGFVNLMITLFVVAAHLLVIVACFWMALILIRRSKVSPALRWVAISALVAAVLLAFPTRLNDPAGEGSEFFFLRYMWPALICIAASLIWSQWSLTSRRA